MATADVINREEALLLSSSPIHGPTKGDNVISLGMSVERKIEVLESLAGTVSNRRSRRWLNDRLLMELVPRLNAVEIRSLFSPAPFGDVAPQSPFCMTKLPDWDILRNIDMDNQAKIIGSHDIPETKKSAVDADKLAVVNAWRRVDSRTREALRRSVVSGLVEGYEERVCGYLTEAGEEDADPLILKIQDPFHRLLLHGVCEFYNLVSVTITESQKGKAAKLTKMTKKKTCSSEVPNITLSHFLKMTNKEFGDPISIGRKLSSIL